MAHLTLEQRYTIQVLREEKLSQQAIANRIGKDKSVVSREIRRNADKRNGTYKAELAQRKYTERMASKPKACKFTDEIKATVDKLLANDCSPEHISLDAVGEKGRPVWATNASTNISEKIKCAKGISIYTCDIMGVNTENAAPPKIRGGKFATK